MSDFGCLECVRRSAGYPSLSINGKSRINYTEVGNHLWKREEGWPPKLIRVIVAIISLCTVIIPLCAILVAKKNYINSFYWTRVYTEDKKNLVSSFPPYSQTTGATTALSIASSSTPLTPVNPPAPTSPAPVPMIESSTRSQKAFTIRIKSEGELAVPSDIVKTQLQQYADADPTHKRMRFLKDEESNLAEDATIFIKSYVQRPDWEENQLVGNRKAIVFIQLLKDTTLMARGGLTWDRTPPHVFHFIGTEDGLTLQSDWNVEQIDKFIKFL